MRLFSVIFKHCVVQNKQNRNNGKCFFNKPSLSQQLMSFSWDKNFFWKLLLLWFGTNCEGAEKTSFQTLFLFQLLLLWVVGVDNFENKKESLSCLFFLYMHSVWKSQKKSYSTLRAKRATFTSTKSGEFRRVFENLKLAVKQCYQICQNHTRIEKSK